MLPPRVMPYLVPPPIVVAVVVRPEAIVCRTEDGQEWPLAREDLPRFQSSTDKRRAA